MLRKVKTDLISAPGSESTPKFNNLVRLGGLIVVLPQIFEALPSPYPHHSSLTTLKFKTLLTYYAEPKLYTKFEVTSFNSCINYWGAH